MVNGTFLMGFEAARFAGLSRLNLPFHPRRQPAIFHNQLTALNFPLWHGGCNEMLAVRLGEHAAR
jgi:hypothetical protein